ncbi:MAG: hypothetical protein J7K53_09085 [Bacteroidales bacterium]|nr:hypothetical protein [Bacteroidales bacterium]
MKRYFFLSLIAGLLFVSCSNHFNDFNFRTGSLIFSVNNKGEITELIDKATGINYLAFDTIAPLMSVRINRKFLYPESAGFNSDSNKLLITYENNIEAEIHVEVKSTHLSFELVSISNPEEIELITWGPYPTTINKIIGETVGVVRGEEFALGIQALNPKTLGGYPWNENDCMPQIDILEQDNYSDLSEEGKRYVLYRVEAAKPADFGSTLQAYCRNRNKERVIKNWNHDKYTAPAFEDGGIIGSKIALFGCQVNKTLETISDVELSEGLPHPVIDNEWGKTAPTASASYIIMSFGEKDIENAIDITKKSGLRYLYHPGPFKNWGHFDLNKQFPNGWDGLKKCVAIAKENNIMLGVHTLSNFITTNDPYVTPVPDNRLAKVGTSIITEEINNSQNEIPVESPDFFNQFKNNNLKTVVVGNELIRYGTVSEQIPWKLLDCQRGAFGTTASRHNKDDNISKLADHGYKVFLTNPELSIEVSKNIAELFNTTGLRQISFDGLEGNRSTGLGNYGEILFTQTWYNNLNKEIRKHYIADASRTSHYFWHVYTRMNWGEPWYAGFRESQTEYRLKNQEYFQRNLMPGMLGWFRMTPETSIEDIEWMLVRSAAFNAGYGFVTNYEVLEENKHSEKILKLLGEWEKARLSGAFSSEQKQRMENINTEFHLEPTNQNEWNLYQVHSFKFNHNKKVRQPGEPLYSTFSFENPAESQPLNFILKAVNGDVKNIKIEIDNFKEISLPVILKAGETIKYTGGNLAVKYSKNWGIIKEFNIDPSELIVATGEHKLTFDCTFTGEKESLVKMEMRITGPAEKITPPSGTSR